MRLHSFAFVVASATSMIVLGSAACSKENPPGSASGGTPTTGGPGPSTDAGGSVVDAGPSVDAAGLCDNPEQIPQSLVVQEFNQYGAAPAPTGGALKPGTYVLNELAVYNYMLDPSASDPGPPPPTGNFGQSTLIVREGAMMFFSSRGKDETALPPSQVRGFLVQRDGNALVLTPSCPAGAGGAPVKYDYSTTDRLLSLRVEANRAEIYRRVD